MSIEINITQPTLDVNITQHVLELEFKSSPFPPTGGGDMRKSVYDPNDDGIVAAAHNASLSDNSDKLGGELPSHYALSDDLLALQTAMASKADKSAAESFLSIALTGTLGNGHMRMRKQSTDPASIVTQFGYHWLDNTGQFNYKYAGAFKWQVNHSLLTGDSIYYLPDGGGVFATEAYVATGLATKQNALGFTPENSASKNQNNGYAGLDSNGLIPSTILPSYVDDILEFANVGAFPITGESEKVYVALDTFKIYRWSGSVYVEISPSPGTTDDVAEGTVNKYFTENRVLNAILTGLSTATNAVITAADSVLGALGKLQKQISDNLTTLTNHTGNTSNPHGVTKTQVGLGNVDNTSDADKPVSTAAQTALNAKQNTIGYTAENASNKATGMSGNETSSVVYLTAKAVYDWAVGLFAKLEGATFIGLIQFSGTGHAGLQVNNLTTAQRVALTPAAGMIVFDSTIGVYCRYNGSFWEFDLTLKASGQTTTSNAATDITGLVTPTLEAGKRYKFSGVILAGCASTGGVKFAATIPSGASIAWSYHGNSSSATAFANRLDTVGGVLGTQAVVTQITGRHILVHGEITVGATPGVLQFQYASATNGQTSTIYSTGTFIDVKKIS